MKIETNNRKDWTRAILIVFLFLFPLIIYGFQLWGGWRFDDGHHLLYLSKYRNFEYLYDPVAVRMQSGAHYTPFNILTYDLANWFFSFEQPAGFYFFHLLLLGAATFAFFLLLSRLVATYIAVFGSLFFLCGFPIAGIAGQLMVGHYILGFLFFSLSLYFYDCSISKNRISWLSLLMFMLACLSKEIFVPLVVVIMIDPRSPIKTRIKPLLAYLAVIAIFWSVRAVMIGQVIGGYNNGLPAPVTVGLQAIVSGVFSYFTKGVDGLILGILICGMVLCAGLSTIKRYGLSSTVLIIAGLVVMLMAPLLPVSLQVGPASPTEIRLITMIWYVLSFCLAIGLQFIWQKQPIIAQGTALFLMVSLAWNTWTYVHKDQLATFAAEFDAFARFVIKKTPCHLVDNHGWSSWTHDLYAAIHPSSKHPVIAPEEIIRAYAEEDMPICRYTNGSIVPFVNSITPLACSTEAPLRAGFRYNGSHITFNFGPNLGTYYLEVNGQYFLALVDGYTGTMMNTERFENVRVIQVKQDGTLNCSPQLHFYPKKQSELIWTRNVSLN